MLPDLIISRLMTCFWDIGVLKLLKLIFQCEYIDRCLNFIRLPCIFTIFAKNSWVAFSIDDVFRRLEFHSRNLGPLFTKLL